MASTAHVDAYIHVFARHVLSNAEGHVLHATRVGVGVTVAGGAVIITRRAGVTGFDYAKLVAFDVACHDYGHDCDHQYSCQELLGPTCQHIYTFFA